MNRQITIRIGSSVIETVQITFLILKLAKVIDWSWWIVLIPLWIHLGLIFLVLMIILIVRLFSRK